MTAHDYAEEWIRQSGYKTIKIAARAAREESESGDPPLLSGGRLGPSFDTWYSLHDEQLPPQKEIVEELERMAESEQS